MSDDAADEPVRSARNSQDEEIDAGVAHHLSEVARRFEAGSDEAEVTQSIIDAAVREIDGAWGAAITLLSHGKVSSPAHTNDIVDLVSTAQTDLNEGPCVDTARHELTLRSDDLRTEKRWPRWAAVAVKHGVLSAMSFQLFVSDHSMGALDVYATSADVFTEESENTGLLLASHAAIAMAGSRRADNLRLALESRDIIGQAKGIIMERYKVGAPRAFDMLLYVSQHTNVKLRDLAYNLATTGELPNV